MKFQAGPQRRHARDRWHKMKHSQLHCRWMRPSVMFQVGPHDGGLSRRLPAVLGGQSLARATRTPPRATRTPPRATRTPPRATRTSPRATRTSPRATRTPPRATRTPPRWRLGGNAKHTSKTKCKQVEITWSVTFFPPFLRQRRKDPLTATNKPTRGKKAE